MPENWKKYNLGEISDDISYGYTESASKEEIGPKFLRITDIQNDFINWNDVPYCKISEKDLIIYQVEIGDIVVARTGNSTGATSIIKDEINAVYASYLIRYRLNKKIAVPEYIDFVLRSNSWKNYVDAIKGGSAQPGANAKQFAAFEINLPPIQEQKSIAFILSALDDKIELNIQMNKTMEEMAKALYKHWFVDFGPFQDEEFVATELGEIPKGWELVQLKKVCRVINGRAYKNEEFLSEGTPIIRIQNLKGAGKTVYSNLELPEDKYVDSGDLIYAWSATFGPYIWAGPKSIYHYHIWKLEVDSGKMSKFYMFHHLDRISAQLKEHGTGSIFTHLTKGSMEKQKMILPKQEVISDFHKKISPYHQLILRNKDQNQTLTQLRDTLLPKLISGEVRVKDVEKTLSEVL